MSRLYLITGFLGAGKTTFLKQFMKQFSSERMHIIVNEFGKEGIDGELLSELGIGTGRDQQWLDLLLVQAG